MEVRHGRVLGREEFVERMLAKRKSGNADVRAHAVPGSARKNRRGPKGVAVVRDDGVRFSSIREAMIAMGYKSFVSTRFREMVESGARFRDGHVYRFEVSGRER